MECREATDRLVDLLYEEGSVEERAAVRSHVDGCGRCRAEADALVRTRSLFSRLEDRDVPAGVSARILRAAAERRPRRLGELLRDWLGPFAMHPALGIATAGLLVVVSSFVIYRASRVREVATRGTGPLLHEEVRPAPSEPVAGPTTGAAPVPETPPVAGGATMASRERARDKGHPAADDEPWPGEEKAPSGSGYAQSDLDARGDLDARRDLQREARGRAEVGSSGSGAGSGAGAFAEPPADWEAGAPYGSPRAGAAAGAPYGSPRAGAAAGAPPPASPAPSEPPLAARERIMQSADALEESEAQTRKRQTARTGGEPSNAALHAEADRLRAQGRCAEAIVYYERLVEQRGSYARADEAAAGEADCLRQLGRCGELADLGRRAPTTAVADNLARCAAPAKAAAKAKSSGKPADEASAPASEKK